MRTAIGSLVALTLMSGPLVGVALAQAESGILEATDPTILWAGELVEAPAAVGDDWEDPAETFALDDLAPSCLLYTSPSPRDRTRSRMPSSA